MIKTLTWFCQMEGFRIEIHAFDMDPYAEDRFTLLAPELMSPRNNGVYIKGEAQYKIVFHSGVSVSDARFTRALDEVGVPTYVFVSMGEDARNVRTAVLLRQYFRQKHMPDPVIQAIVYDSKNKDILNGATNWKGKSYGIEFIGDLEEMFEVFVKLPIDSWRLTSIEPMGRALEHPELMLGSEDYRRMFDFIRAKRAEGWPVRYGCCHYLGLDLEHEVRDAYFICSAGVYTASIMSNGDIGACLDIERRPETIQGNIRRDRFRDVWENRFELFRHDLSDLNETCRSCEHQKFCRGDAHHSWDYDRNEPMVCMRNILF
jgi:radical SAM protein with 4Fe4S-binding SPASM domain